MSRETYENSKEQETDNGYEDDLRLLFDAMIAAKEAFNKHIDREGYDPAFWKLEMTGWVLDVEFQKWKKIIIDRVD